MPRGWAVAGLGQLVAAASPGPVGLHGARLAADREGYRYLGADITTADTPYEAGSASASQKDGNGVPELDPLSLRGCGRSLVGNQEYLTVYGGEAVYARRRR